MHLRVGVTEIVLPKAYIQENSLTGLGTIISLQFVNQIESENPGVLFLVLNFCGRLGNVGGRNIGGNTDELPKAS